MKERGKRKRVEVKKQERNEKAMMMRQRWDGGWRGIDVVLVALARKK